MKFNKQKPLSASQTVFTRLRFLHNVTFQTCVLIKVGKTKVEQNLGQFPPRDFISKLFPTTNTRYCLLHNAAWRGVGYEQAKHRTWGPELLEERGN